MFSGTWTFGDFGPVSKEMAEATGAKNYNVECDYKMYKCQAVLNVDGTLIYANSMIIPGQIDMIKWVSDKELEEIKNSREPAEAPITPLYIKHQPGKSGKLVWFSGPPGVGKSTTAQLLARNHGYVYYEADCLINFVNPFVDIMHPNPTMAQMNQNPLKV